MVKTLFNDGWKYKSGNGDLQAVSLPHDAVIGTKRNPDMVDGTKKAYFENGSWEYVKVFTAPEEWKGKEVKLLFDGVQNHACVYLNGNYICRHAYGYTHFFADLTRYLRIGEKNVLAVGCSTHNDSRWYVGGGIYRDVWLYVGDKDSVPPFGVKVTTLSVEKTATLRIDVQSEKEFKAEIVGTGVVVKGTKSVRVEVPNPRLWSDETPNLYTLRVTVGDETLEETFGIRTLSVSAKTGLLVNGKEVKLRGGCIHHDSGFLGVKTIKEYEFRKIRKMKEAGYNAVRMAHHPASRYLLEACDYYGLYVMDELTDMWEMSKSPDDYSNEFSAHCVEDIRAMTEKDYNHPCVIMYSIGNEIFDLATQEGVEKAKFLHAEVKKCDPTRFTTAAMNGLLQLVHKMNVAGLLSEGQKPQEKRDINEQMDSLDAVMAKICNTPEMDETLLGGSGAVDIPGYNYMHNRYAVDETKYPDRVIVGSETYPKDITVMWDYIKEHHNVIGDFVWTAWDYIGETGIGCISYKPRDYHDGFYALYPAITANCGDIDLAGDRLPQSYYREIVYGLRKAPYIAVHDPKHLGEKEYLSSWSWDGVISSWAYDVKEGTPLSVDVYGEGEVELFLNDVSLGKKVFDSTRKVQYTVPYTKGCLKAVSNGEEYVLFSAEKQKQISVSVEKDGNIAFVEISVTDENGTLLIEEEPLIKLSVSNGTVLGFGSGNPFTEESYTDSEHTAYRGKALAIIEMQKDCSVTVSAFGKIKEYSL